MTPATLTADPLAHLNPAHVAQNAKAAQTVAEATRGRDCVLETKWDGWRILAQVAEDGVRLYSRAGKRYETQVPGIVAEIAGRFPVGTWLDGEAVALEADGRPARWGTAQSVLGSTRPHRDADRIAYVVFDLLAHGGLDARPLPFRSRRKLLEQIFTFGGFERLMLSPTFEATDENLAALLALGHEGAMVKDLAAPYRSGQRVDGQRKLKGREDADVVVTGFKPGTNGFAGMVGAVEFGQYRDGKLEPRGRCSGMTMQVREAMTADPAAWIGTVIEIAHNGAIDGDGGWRHPRYLRQRPDKAATQCEWS